MKLKIEEPNWWDLIQWYNTETKNICYDGFIKWFQEHVEPINKILAEGTEVFGADPGAEWGSGVWWDEVGYKGMKNSGCHKKGLLINIQPIEKETAEDVLRDLLKHYELDDKGFGTLVQRAKNILNYE